MAWHEHDRHSARSFDEPTTILDGAKRATIDLFPFACFMFLFLVVIPFYHGPHRTTLFPFTCLEISIRCFFP
jgi:hypothetical protein